MSPERNQLGPYWELVLEDTLLDVAAALAATQPGPAAARTQTAAAQHILTLRWAVRELVGEPN